MTRVRVGVDVGGTFTKAVAVDSPATIVATRVVPTTHTAEAASPPASWRGRRARREVGAGQRRPRHPLDHQAVNALLEGDAATVGVIGLGRRPDLGAREKRTRLARRRARPGQAAPGPARVLRRHRRPAVEAEVRGALERLPRGRRRRGVRGRGVRPRRPDQRDARSPHWPREAGLPVCTSTELTGLYGLELRTVTAALNASILPIAVRTGAFVADGVRAAGIDAPVMVMRSDGGATDLAGFRPRRCARCTRVRRRRWPARCATPASPTRSWSRSAARRPTSPPSAAAARRCRTCGSRPRHGAAQRRRARRRRRRRIDAAGPPGPRVRRRPPLRPHRRPAYACFMPTRRLRRRDGRVRGAAARRPGRLRGARHRRRARGRR